MFGADRSGGLPSCADAFLVCTRFHHECPLGTSQCAFSGRVFVLKRGRLVVELGRAKVHREGVFVRLPGTGPCLGCARPRVGIARRRRARIVFVAARLPVLYPSIRAAPTAISARRLLDEPRLVVELSLAAFTAEDQHLRLLGKVFLPGEVGAPSIGVVVMPLLVALGADQIHPRVSARMHRR